MKALILLSMMLAIVLAGKRANCETNTPIDSARWKSPIRATPASIERARLLIQLNQNLPYQQGARSIMGTIGQSIKLCDWVIIGTVARLQNSRPEDPDPRRVTMDINVKSNLFGKIENNRTVVDLYPMNQPENVYKAGDKVLVFLSNVDYGVNVYPWAFSPDFDKKKIPFSAAKSPVLVFDGNLSVIKLDNPANTQQILAAVDAYAKVFRREKPSEDGIYAVLRELVLSPVARVREDARSDIVMLLRHSKTIDFVKVLSDENIDEGIKNYIRQILIPDRENKRL